MAKNKLSKAELKALINDLSGHDVTKANLQHEKNFEHEELSNFKFIDYKEKLAFKNTNAENHESQIIKISFKLKVAMLCSLPIILLIPQVKQYLPINMLPNQYQQIALMFFSTILIVYCGSIFFKKAFLEIKNSQPSTMLLLSLSLVILFGYNLFVSYYAIIGDTYQIALFWQLALIIVISLYNVLLKVKHKKQLDSYRNKQVILPEKMFKKTPQQTLIEIDSHAARIGDVIEIEPHQIVPIDGVIISGETIVDESNITNNNLQVIKKSNHTLLAGTVNGIGKVEIQVIRPQNMSYYYQLQYELLKTQKTIKPLPPFWCKGLFYWQILISVISFIMSKFNTSVEQSLSVMTTVLLLGLPNIIYELKQVTNYKVLKNLFEQGIMIFNSDVFKLLEDIDYALIDKTGTLTEGTFKIRSLRAVSDDYSDNDILAIMATLEVHSKHPLAKSILRRAKETNVNLMHATELVGLPGIGIAGVINNERFAIVAIDYLKEHALAFDQNYFDKLTAAGNSVSYLITNEKVIGIVAQGDVIKPTATKLVNGLKQLSIIPIMLTGDNNTMAQIVAKTLGIKQFNAQLKPQDKLKFVETVQKKGRVLIIGDGQNDQVAFNQADMRVIMGLDYQMDNIKADVALLNSEATDILKLFKMGRWAKHRSTLATMLGITYHLLIVIMIFGLSFIIIPSPIMGVIISIMITYLLTYNMKKLTVETSKKN